MTVKKTEARKGDKKLHDVEVTEVDKVNKRIKIHFVSYSTQFYEWRFFGGDERSDHALKCTYFKMPFPETNLSPI